MPNENNRTASDGNRGGGDKGGRRRYFRRRKRKGDEGAAPSANANKERPTDSASSSRRSSSRGNRAPKEERARDDRNRDERGRDDRNRDERGRDDRSREDRGRDERGRDERGRDDRGRDDRSRSGDDRARGGNNVRPRRRRRRSRTDQPESVAVVSESIIDAIAHDYVAPQAVFIYTHIVRPANQGLSEFRADHFTKVGRRLEDFNIDLGPLFDPDRQKNAAAKSGEAVDSNGRRIKTWQEEWEDAGREEAEGVQADAPGGEDGNQPADNVHSTTIDDQRS